MRRQASIVAVAAVLVGTGAYAGSTSAGAAGPAAGPGVITPYVGGVLNVLSIADVDYLDPNLSYYTAGYAVARAYSRQLYTFPAVAGHTTDTVPDLATAAPVVSDGGKVYRITIRTGALWNTAAPRQVSAGDVVRGVKVTCNPYEPFGGLPDYESLIKGMTKFCNGFERVRITPTAIKHYLEGTALPGVKAINSKTVQFTLAHPDSSFADELTMPAFSPRPVEMDKYLPGSGGEAQHTISDGPYEVASYRPGQSIVLDRNPAWSAASDPIRKAYVNEIKITEGQSSSGIESKILANKPSADVALDSGVDVPEYNALKADHDPRLAVAPSLSINPQIVFNTASPNAGGALRHRAVRRAISFALNRGALIRATDNQSVSTPLTQVLPAGIGGSKNFNDYPHSDAKAKALLKRSGFPHPTLKVLYRSDASSQVELADAIRAELKPVGVHVKLVSVGLVGFYVKYLERPQSARAGGWDIATSGWGPDWYGDAAASFFQPLYDGRILPPESSDFGLYKSAVTDQLIDRAARASSKSAADALWTKADRQVMSDAAVYPVEDPEYTVIHGAQVNNFVLIPAFAEGDFTNVWLSSGASS